MRIIIEVPDSALESTDTEHKMRIILMDSIYEFGMHRSPAKEYVEKRYPYFDETHRERKAKQVEDRCLLAQKLHRSDIRFEKSDPITNEE